MDEVVHRACSASSIIQYFLNDGRQEELIKPFKRHKLGSHCKYWKNRIRVQNNFDKLGSLKKQDATQFGK